MSTFGARSQLNVRVGGLRAEEGRVCSSSHLADLRGAVGVSIGQ
jgi:hypothetical protein